MIIERRLVEIDLEKKKEKGLGREKTIVFDPSRPRNERRKWDSRGEGGGKLRKLARETLERVGRSSNFVTRYRCSLRARIYRLLLFPPIDGVIYAFPRRGEKNVAQRDGDRASSRSLENVSRANEGRASVEREADRPIRYCSLPISEAVRSGTPSIASDRGYVD